MISMKLRAVATALSMSLAAAAAVGLCATPAVAASVRPAVGNALNEARSAMSGGNCNSAMSAVRRAEGVGSLSADEKKYIEQMKNYIASASKGACGADTAVGAQAKFASDYRARRYRDVIADADLLRKYGAYNAQSQQVVAQSYYALRDYAGCLRAATGGSAGMLELRMRCAYDGHEDEIYRSALEQLVASTNKPEYWARLIKNIEGSKALSDPQTLDIYRVKLLTGNVRTGDDYTMMAQFALQFGFAAEASSVLDAGIRVKALQSSGRTDRLLKMSRDTQASNLRNLPRVESEAKSAKTGDLLIKLGQDYCGMGRGKDAVAAVQSGIAKGVADKDGAQIRLGHAYYCAGQKPQALAVLAKVKGTDNNAMVAKLWSLYIKSH
jgi:hypothetical protein